ncbi:MAG: succinate dehydrogenase [Myxococcota bacterium]
MPFLWARWGSVLSLVPLGVWTVNHLWDNLSAFRGAAAWERSVTEYAHPVSHALTLFLVLGPLFLHTVWGVQRVLSARPNNLAYPFFENLKYLLQRMAAVGVLFFLGAHLWLAMLQPRLLEGRPEPFEDIARTMRFHGPTLLVYLLGTLGVAYHLANGLFGFAWTWGLATGRKGFARVGVLSVVVFVALLAMSWGVVWALWQAGDALGPHP